MCIRDRNFRSSQGSELVFVLQAWTFRIIDLVGYKHDAVQGLVLRDDGDDDHHHDHGDGYSARHFLVLLVPWLRLVRAHQLTSLLCLLKPKLLPNLLTPSQYISGLCFARSPS